MLNCSQVESFLPGSIVRLLTCRTTCCAENLCNVIEFNQTEADFLGKFKFLLEFRPETFLICFVIDLATTTVSVFKI